MATKRKSSPKRKAKRPVGRAPRAAKQTVPRPYKRKEPESFRARSVTPSLTVSDLQRSIGWYQGLLGFTVASRWEDSGHPRGVELAAGGTRLMLNQDDWSKGRDREKGAGVRLWFGTIQDIDQLAAEITSRGGALDYAPRVMPWGDRTFAITDPDGYHLTFTQLKR